MVAYAAGFGAAHAVELAAPSTAGLPLCLGGRDAGLRAVFLLCGGLNLRDRERLAELLVRVRQRLGRQPATSAKLGQSPKSFSGKARANASTSSR